MGGCLFVLGRTIARACFALGAMVTTILIQGISFVFVTIIGPLWLGSVRELVVAALRITHNGRSVQSDWQMGSRPAYVALSGVVWVAGFFLARALWHLLSWISAEAIARLEPNLASWLPMTLLIVLIFTIGSVVGAIVHRRDHGMDSGW